MYTPVPRVSSRRLCWLPYPTSSQLASWTLCFIFSRRGGLVTFTDVGFTRLYTNAVERQP